jgi:NifB/MoaA-like Fe-S oxidoreductase
MNTETQNTVAAVANISTTEDIVKRGIKRELPCKLTDQEELEIARRKASAEAELEEVQADFDDAKNEWKSRLEEVEKRIALMGAELRTGEQKRVIDCYERFVAGTIETVRTDNGMVIDRRAASLADTQRALPTVGRDEAREEQEQAADAAKTQRDANVEEDDEGDVVAPAGEPKKNGRAKRK